MKFLRCFWFLCVTLVLMVSCDKDSVGDKKGWSDGFKALMEAYYTGKYFASAEISKEAAVFRFVDGTAVSVLRNDVRTINAGFYGKPEISEDARTGEWTLNKVATGLKIDKGADLSESMPICIYFDDSCLYVAMSNGETLLIGGDPCSSITLFRFSPSDNPELSESISCNIEGTDIVGNYPLSLSTLELIPRFNCRGRNIRCNGEEQVSGKSKQDFSSPVKYEVELFNGGTIEFTVSLNSSVDFPTVMIFTKNGEFVVDKDKYIEGTIRIEDPGCLYSDKKVVEVPMKIKGRGNSSWNTSPKKPYRIKMSEKTSVFGQPKDKDWVLLASYSDKTLLRDMTGMEISRICGMSWTPVFHHVELYFNNQYQGVYLLGDHKKVSRDRVDIDIVGENDNSGDAVTGGYYLEIEQQMDEPVCFWTSMSVPMMFSDPEQPTEAQKTYVRNYFRDFEQALQGKEMTDPDKGYAKYIDVESFVNYYIIEELTKNIDGNLRKSTFLTKERGKQLEMYHVWDFDLTLGNCNYFDSTYGNGLDNSYKGFFIKDFGYLGYGSGWFVRLFEDPVFKSKVKARWNALKPQLSSKIPAFIDTNMELIKDAAGRNFKRWPILDIWVWPNVAVTGSYQDEVSYMRKFYVDRLNWLDAEINKW